MLVERIFELKDGSRYVAQFTGGSRDVDDEHIVCLDEKTSVQALERKYPHLPMQHGIGCAGSSSTSARSCHAPLAAIVDAQGEKISDHENLWQALVNVAILVFVIDVAVPRIRLFDGKFKAAA